jgi:hypothetical protein
MMTYPDKFEHCKYFGTLVGVNGAQNGVELGMHTAVSQTHQKTAQYRQVFTGKHERTIKKGDSVNEQLIKCDCVKRQLSANRKVF